MDKVNALLIGIICILTAVSIYIIWDTCFRNEPCAEGELAMGQAVIAMNDDGCAINGGTEDVWFRAKETDDDSWIYSSAAVAPGEMSETLIAVEKCDSPVRVEGIQTDWVGADVNDGKRAFEVFRSEPLHHYKASFL